MNVLLNLGMTTFPSLHVTHDKNTPLSLQMRLNVKSRPLQTKVSEQNNVEVEVARCSRGQYFGELALVTNKPRAASVYAVGGTKCLGTNNI